MCDQTDNTHLYLFPVQKRCTKSTEKRKSVFSHSEVAGVSLHSPTNLSKEQQMQRDIFIRYLQEYGKE